MWFFCCFFAEIPSVWNLSTEDFQPTYLVVDETVIIKEYPKIICKLLSQKNEIVFIPLSVWKVLQRCQREPHEFAPWFHSAVTTLICFQQYSNSKLVIENEFQQIAAGTIFPNQNSGDDIIGACLFLKNHKLKTVKLLSQEKSLKITAQAYGICLYNEGEKESNTCDDQESFNTGMNQCDLENVMKIVSRLKKGYF